MNVLITICSIMFCQIILAQDVNFDWVQIISDGGFEHAYDTATDSLGNVYTITNKDGGSVQKLDPSGNVIWIKEAGDSRPYAITIDPSGNVLVVGRLSGTDDFDPGPAYFALSSNGVSDIAVYKLDSNGDFVWAKSVGGAETDQPESVSTDANGNVYITGYFRDSVDFDPSAGVTSLTAVGNGDIFILKLDSAGNFMWVAQMGGVVSDFGKGISVGSNGDVYAAGYYNATVDFDPGPGVFNLVANPGENAGFVMKLNTNGEFVWAKNITGNNYVRAHDIVVGENDTVYVTGFFSSTIDFDPGPGTSFLTSNGFYDAFIQKLDQDGNFIWAKGFGGPGLDESNSIDLDEFGNVYTAGEFRDTANFDPGSGSAILNPNGISDVFIHKLNANGDFQWVKQVGGSAFENAYGIAVGNNGNVFTAGSFQGTVDFDTGVDTFFFTSNNSFDGFTHKLVQCLPNSGVDTVTACDSFTWIDGVTYTSSTNSPTDTLTNIAGCDSIVTLNLAINYSAVGTDTHSACDTFTWIDGVTYTSSNNSQTYVYAGGATNGCDSIVTLDLTILNSSSGTDVQTSCDTFTWIDGITYTSTINTPTWIVPNAVGCDSVITLNLTINNSNSGIDSVSACDSFTWIDGITYTSSTNLPTWTLTNSVGCDSVVTLNLIMNNSNAGIDVQTACESYTWIDGISYTSSTNTPTWIVPNVAGCDSVVTLNLTILNSTVGTDFQTACDTFTWINGVTYTSSTNTPDWILTNADGCDSLVTLNLTIINSTAGTELVSACESFTWIDGITYTSSTNSPTWTLVNSVGCDSIVTLNLMINNSNSWTDIETACDSFTWIDGVTYTSSTTSPVWTLTNSQGCDSIVTLELTIPDIDVSTALIDETISANSSGLSYQWLDCADFSPISGEMNQSFTATSNGQYAVIVSDNNCSDTSACVQINTIGLAELQFTDIQLFPNPNNGSFTIQLPKVYAEVAIEISNSVGQIIAYSEYTNISTIHSAIQDEAGMYLLRIIVNQEAFVVPLFKK